MSAAEEPVRVRDCLVRKTDGSYYDGSYRSWQEPAVFHTWTKHTRCAVGDGSMIEWVTLAIIEWPDGKVDMCEPCALQFIANMVEGDRVRVVMRPMLPGES